MEHEHDKRLIEALRATGRRVTPQRVGLHRALQRIGRHASADDVMRAAEESLPNVSLPTVYAALDLFAELGIARRVDAGAGPALYDPRTDDHGHFACRRCGTVEDVDEALDTAAVARAARAAGLSVERAHVLLTGVCARCRASSGRTRRASRAAS